MVGKLVLKKYCYCSTIMCSLFISLIAVHVQNLTDLFDLTNYIVHCVDDNQVR